MKIEKDENTDELVIRLPLRQPSYDVMGELMGYVDNLVGVIAGDDCSLSQSIDMSYKGKGPQEGMPIVMLEDEEMLRGYCRAFDIDVIDLPMCGKCLKPIRGAFTFSISGDPICGNCNKV